MKQTGIIFLLGIFLLSVNTWGDDGESAADQYWNPSEKEDWESLEKYRKWRVKQRKRRKRQKPTEEYQVDQSDDQLSEDFEKIQNYRKWRTQDQERKRQPEKIKKVILPFRDTEDKDFSWEDLPDAEGDYSFLPTGYVGPTVGALTIDLPQIDIAAFYGFHFGFILPLKHTAGLYLLTWAKNSGAVDTRHIYSGVEYTIWDLFRTPLFLTARLGLNRRTNLITPSNISLSGIHFSTGPALGVNLKTKHHMSFSFEANVLYTFGGSISGNNLSRSLKPDTLYSLLATLNYWF